MVLSFGSDSPITCSKATTGPQKVLYISGDVATTGVVQIPGLINPSTSLPFRQEFVVNPGEVTVVELPSQDVGDNTDNETDFDVEAELIASIQRKGIHVVTGDQSRSMVSI